MLWPRCRLSSRRSDDPGLLAHAFLGRRSFRPRRLPADARRRRHCAAGTGRSRAARFRLSFALQSCAGDRAPRLLRRRPCRQRRAGRAHRRHPRGRPPLHLPRRQGRACRARPALLALQLSRQDPLVLDPRPPGRHDHRHARDAWLGARAQALFRHPRQRAAHRPRLPQPRGEDRLQGLPGPRPRAHRRGAATGPGARRKPRLRPRHPPLGAEGCHLQRRRGRRHRQPRPRGRHLRRDRRRQPHRVAAGARRSRDRSARADEAHGVNRALPCDDRAQRLLRCRRPLPRD